MYYARTCKNKFFGLLSYKIVVVRWQQGRTVGKPCMVMGHKHFAAKEEDVEAGVDLAEVDNSTHI